MRIGVMGAGGVGGYYGGLLARAGFPVVLIARGDHLSALRRQGLRVESVRSGTFTVQVPVTDRPEEAGVVDLLLYCVKRYHDETAIPALAPMVGPQTLLLPLQNGVDSADRLAEVYGWERVLLGTTYIDAHIKAPGLIAQTGGPCRIVFGERDGSLTERARRVEATLRKAEIDAVLSSDIQREVWTKFVYICGLSGMLSITRATLAEVLDLPETRDLLVRTMRETAEVGRARGVNLPPDVVERTLALFEASRWVATSSMKRDLLAGRRIEVDALNGTVVRLGRQAGVPTPVNEVLYGVLKLADEQARRREASGTPSEGGAG